MSYKDELQKATDILAADGYIFFGQNMRSGGTSMFHMIKHLPLSQRIELPVFEDVQMGMGIGMALAGLKICSVFPRMDFLILGINQLVNHADKIKRMSDGQFTLNGLIIRSAIGSVKPLFPGEQHSGDYCDGIQKMCKDIKVVKLTNADTIVESYADAMKSDIPTLLVEIPDLYNHEMKSELIEARKAYKGTSQ